MFALKLKLERIFAGVEQVDSLVSVTVRDTVVTAHHGYLARRRPLRRRATHACREYLEIQAYSIHRSSYRQPTMPEETASSRRDLSTSLKRPLLWSRVAAIAATCLALLL